MENSGKEKITAGLLGDNTVLSALMVISPVIMCGDSLRNAFSLIYAFSLITFFSVVISSFVPKKLPYAVKIIIYAVIASLVYIPVKLLAGEIYPDSIERVGIYYPLLAVNSLIVFRTESKFFAMKKMRMIGSLVFYILGFDAVMLVTGFIRELLAYGTINSRIVDINTLIGGLAQPFGGFIFLGLMCGLYRKIRSSVQRENDTVRSTENVSDK